MLLIAGPIVDEMVPLVAEYLAAVAEPTIVIDSPGGAMDASIEIAAGIEAHGHVKCIVRRRASSGAFGILQACQTRVLSSQAKLMTHRPRSMVVIPMDVDLAHFIAEDIAKATLRWNAICSRRLRITPMAYAAKVTGRDWVMDAAEALSVGAADIVTPE